MTVLHGHTLYFAFPPPSQKKCLLLGTEAPLLAALKDESGKLPGKETSEPSANKQQHNHCYDLWVNIRRQDILTTEILSVQASSRYHTNQHHLAVLAWVEAISGL